MKLEFRKLPDSIRVKLDGEGESLLWDEIEEKGGVKEFCDCSDYTFSQVYNWRSKDVFIPVEFVKELLGDQVSEHVMAFKGRGRSVPVDDPQFPLLIGELLTRVDCSASVNREGVPVYRSDEISLIDRFRELLSGIGDVPVSVYSRESGYELRYPKYLQVIFEDIEFEEDLSALIDEKGSIGERRIIIGEREIPVEEFDGELYSRRKSLELALRRQDAEKVEEILGEEADRIKDVVELF